MVKNRDQKYSNQSRLGILALVLFDIGILGNVVNYIVFYLLL